MTRAWKRWLRPVCSIVLFTLLFGAVFVSAQYVLLYKYQPEDCWEQRYEDYAEQPAGSLDAVFLGQSQTYWGVSPIILWNESGLASINMSGVFHSHVIVYEQLKLLLELNAPPRYAIFTPTSLVHHTTVDDERVYHVFEQFIYTLPTLRHKLSATAAMLGDASKPVDLLAFAVPLLHYHSRWKELINDDFRLPSSWKYQPWLKGQLPMMTDINITEFVDALEECTTEVTLNEDAVEGWRKIFALCRDNDITPIALILPRFDRALKGTPLEALLAFLEEEDIETINYMDEVSLAEMGWDYRRHFKDREHLNLRGSLYLASDLAYQLADVMEWDDHTDDPAYSQWNADRDTFFETYRTEICETLGEDYWEFAMEE